VVLMGMLDDPVSAGVRAGIGRAAAYDVRVESPEDVLKEPLELAGRVLGQREVTDRFRELFSELVTVAAIARSYYGDAALTESDIESYFDDSSDFFNSFRHP
jgi:hypothetical protein